MTAADNEYSRIIARLQEDIPELATQLTNEFRTGRAMSEEALRETPSYESRAMQLTSSKLPPLGKNDVATIPYSENERIEMIREALLTLADTMHATRSSIYQFTREMETAPLVEFVDPESGAGSTVDLNEETRKAEIARRAVHDELEDSAPRSGESL